ncbi:RNA polymerase sigma factor [Candidatus Parcubacteria bacterium]|nr:RNA polymerase sigma factor [Candidatus Parcubacteria bacterium]
MYEIDSIEEKLILKRAVKGDRDAFAEIYDFYVVKIYRFVYLKTSSKEVAEDLTADTFLKCWKYIQKKKNEGNSKDIIKNNKLGPFLYKIARNLVIDYYRKKKDLPVEIDEVEKYSIGDDKQDLLSQITIKQEIEELRISLNSLKDDYQEILILRYVEDLDMKEIADITGKSEGSLRVQIHRATKSLEKVMKMRKKTE